MTGSGTQGISDKSIDVLAVDDDADALHELAHFLTRATLSCATAIDGWTALRMVSEGLRPRIVVSDLRMPELSGLQFAEELNRLPEAERPEVIFVSGNAGYDDAVEAIRLGARDMLTKPLDMPKLVRAVKSALLVRKMRRDVPAAGAAANPVPKGTVKHQRATLDALRAVRKIRSRYFPSALFSDPCWEMLLDLYDGQLANEEVTVTSLGAASGAPLTTALRRMDALQSHGLIERTDHPDDKRRTVIRLSRAGLDAVEQFFETYSHQLEK